MGGSGACTWWPCEVGGNGGGGGCWGCCWCAGATTMWGWGGCTGCCWCCWWCAWCSTPGTGGGGNCWYSITQLIRLLSREHLNHPLLCLPCHSVSLFLLLYDNRIHSRSLIPSVDLTIEAESLTIWFSRLYRLAIFDLEWYSFKISREHLSDLTRIVLGIHYRGFAVATVSVCLSICA